MPDFLTISSQALELSLVPAEQSDSSLSAINDSTKSLDFTFMEEELPPDEPFLAVKRRVFREDFGSIYLKTMATGFAVQASSATLISFGFLGRAVPGLSGTSGLSVFAIVLGMEQGAEQLLIAHPLMMTLVGYNAIRGLGYKPQSFAKPLLLSTLLNGGLVTILTYLSGALITEAPEFSVVAALIYAFAAPAITTGLVFAFSEAPGPVYEPTPSVGSLLDSQRQLARCSKLSLQF